MNDKPQSPPEGYPQVMAYLHVADASAAIDFYVKIFGAKERFRLPIGDRVGHAELTLGDSVIMLADMCPADKKVGEIAKGDIPPITMMVYVPDVDATLDAAVKAGAFLAQPAADQFYGDRTGIFRDPFGMVWNLATRVRDVSHEDMKAAVAKMQG